MKLKSVGVLIAGFFSIALVGAAAAMQSNPDVEAAEKRLRSTLERVQPAQIGVPDVRQKSEIPDNLKGIKHQVPVMQDYGHDKLADVDPIEVSKRYNATVPDMAQAEKGDLMAFVSFSMPEASLKRIAAETAKAGGVLVIRGFVNGSLKQTIAATEELAALQATLLIHPDLFDHYQIVEVPTYVIAADEGNESGNCTSNAEYGLCTQHYQVKGDVSLHSALEYFGRQKSDKSLSEISMAKLAKLEGRQ